MEMAWRQEEETDSSKSDKDHESSDSRKQHVSPERLGWEAKKGYHDLSHVQTGKGKGLTKAGLGTRFQVAPCLWRGDRKESAAFPAWQEQ